MCPFAGFRLCGLHCGARAAESSRGQCQCNHHPGGIEGDYSDTGENTEMALRMSNLVTDQHAAQISDGQHNTEEHLQKTIIPTASKISATCWSTLMVE